MGSLSVIAIWKKNLKQLDFPALKCYIMPIFKETIMKLQMVLLLILLFSANAISQLDNTKSKSWVSSTTVSHKDSTKNKNSWISSFLGVDDEDWQAPMPNQSGNSINYSPAIGYVLTNKGPKVSFGLYFHSSGYLPFGIYAEYVSTHPVLFMTSSSGLTDYISPGYTRHVYEGKKIEENRYGINYGLTFGLIKHMIYLNVGVSIQHSSEEWEWSNTEYYIRNVNQYASNGDYRGSKSGIEERNLTTKRLLDVSITVYPQEFTNKGGMIRVFGTAGYFGNNPKVLIGISISAFNIYGE